MAIPVESEHPQLQTRPICQCCDPKLNAFTLRMNAELTRRDFVIGAGTALAGLALPGCVGAARAQASQPSGVLFENVRIFDGISETLSAPSNVLVAGNVITSISTGPITPPPDLLLTRVAGNGRTLMPGLIDAHVHIMFATVPQLSVLTSDVGFVNVAAVRAASDMMPIVERARSDGHPEVALLRELTKALKGDVAIEGLEHYPAWLAAKYEVVARQGPEPPHQRRRTKKAKKAKA